MKEQKFLDGIKIINSLERESGIRLTLLQKIIAVTNGSITPILEIYCGQTIVVETISQRIRQADSDVATCLGIEPGESINDREVLIRGERDGMVFAYARSYMPVKYLPPELSESLMTEDTPLGKLLIKYRIEGRRELGDVCIREDGVYETKTGKIDRFLIKRYNFISNKKAIMHITEVYPLSVIQ